jgi:hypothetical protein
VIVQLNPPITRDNLPLSTSLNWSTWPETATRALRDSEVYPEQSRSLTVSFQTSIAWRNSQNAVTHLPLIILYVTLYLVSLESRPAPRAVILSSRRIFQMFSQLRGAIMLICLYERDQQPWASKQVCTAPQFVNFFLFNSKDPLSKHYQRVKW